MGHLFNLHGHCLTKLLLLLFHNRDGKIIGMASASSQPKYHSFSKLCSMKHLQDVQSSKQKKTFYGQPNSQEMLAFSCWFTEHVSVLQVLRNPTGETAIYANVPKLLKTPITYTSIINSYLTRTQKISSYILAMDTLWDNPSTNKQTNKPWFSFVSALPAHIKCLSLHVAKSSTSSYWEPKELLPSENYLDMPWNKNFTSSYFPWAIPGLSKLIQKKKLI